MGLAGWNVNNKLKLIIDGSKIDGGMTNFPVLITLASGSGQTGYDTTCVFDELTTVSGSYSNRKKVAVTTTISGVETELYVEIDRWDDTTASGNKQAWLWTKVPTIVSGTNTDLYLYYDSNHTTNSGYIGDTGEIPAQNVWNDNFKAVYHLGQDPVNGYGDADTTHLDEDMADIADWVDSDNINGESTQVTFDSKSCMKLDTNVAAADNRANRNRDIGNYGNRVVVETSAYFDALGTLANNDMMILNISKALVRLMIRFASDGLFIYDGAAWNEVGTNLVVQDVWQKWTFDIDFTTPASATIDVYLNDVLQESDVDCSFTGFFIEGEVHLIQCGYTTNDRITYVDYIKIGNKFINNIKDSTSNDNNGTPAGDMTTGDLVDGKVGKALDFDGSDDNIGCGSDSSLDDIGTITIESTFKAAGWGDGGGGRVIAKSTTGNENGYNVFLQTSDSKFGFIQGWTTTDGVWYTPNSSISLGSWYHSVVQYDRSYGVGDKPIMYLNSVSQTVTTSQAPVGTIESDAAQNVCIAARAAAAREFEGIIDEVRISSVTRPAAWIKATYYSNWDGLITFKDAGVKYYFSGQVYELGSTISGAQLFMYRRDTGVYLGSTTSSGDGGFYVETTYSGSHFLVCLDPEGGSSYNDLIYGEMYPATIFG